MKTVDGFELALKKNFGIQLGMQLVKVTNLKKNYNIKYETNKRKFSRENSYSPEKIHKYINSQDGMSNQIAMYQGNSEKRVEDMSSEDYNKIMRY